jgi:DNA-binding transcriptional LysR family regulator
MNTLNLNLLRVFHTVARLQSFTRAAEALFLTQPGISKHVKSLEDHYGTRLFDRLGKKVVLTQAGETLFPSVDRIFQLLDRSEKEIADLKGMKSGDLRIGASVTIGIYFLPGILQQFQKLHPGIRVSLDIDLNRQIVEKILDNAVDIGLLGAPETDDRLSVTPFFKDELVVIAPVDRAWAARDAVRPLDLLGERFIFSQPGSGTRTIIEDRLRQAGVVLTNTIEFGHTEAVKKAVEAGLGISILSRSTIVKEEKLGTIRSVALSEVDLDRHFYFAYRKDKYLTRLVRTFLQFIVYRSGEREGSRRKREHETG